MIVVVVIQTAPVAISNMNNYIEGSNPFHLAGPPSWWLSRLWDFDQSLVVVPSVQGFHYRIAQRRPLDTKAKLVNDIAREGDSLVMAQYGLVPVTTLLATARWDNPLMWVDLAERAPWRQGGAEAYEKKLNEIEQRKQLDIAAKQDDMTNILARDAYKMYQIKKGTRIGLAGGKVTRDPFKGSDPNPMPRSAAIKILDSQGKPTYRI